MAERIGERTVKLEGAFIESYAAIAGKKEGEGPLGSSFDEVFQDEYFNEETFEQAEISMQKRVLELALKKTNCRIKDIDFMLGGDLLSQCIGSNFAARNLGIPHIGVYGACSTFCLEMGLGGILVDSGAARRVATVTSSHFCSSERQFRSPLEYGNQRTPTAQWTTTAAGSTLISSSGDIKIDKVCFGEVIDLGVTDANNMGAAMAPAAADTIKAFFEDTQTKPSDYDGIFTGDLGFIGSDILYELMEREGEKINPQHNDCGMMIFNRMAQDVHGGGSGCGCSASVCCGHIFKRLSKGELKRILVCATGALLSPISSGQGESIPSIAHLVELVYNNTAHN